MLLTIETSPSAEQTALNLRRRNEIVADPELARLPHRIETDRHGHIPMNPIFAPIFRPGSDKAYNRSEKLSSRSSAVS